MTQDQLINSVAEKLGLDKEDVYKVWMHQFKTVSQKLREDDVTIIYLPHLGSFKFKYTRGIRKIRALEAKVRALSKNPEKTFGGMNTLEVYENKLRLLRMKVSYEPLQYDGIRLKEIDHKMKYYKLGRYQEFMKQLRENRANETFKEFVGQPDQDFPAEDGDIESLL